MKLDGIYVIVNLFQSWIILVVPYKLRATILFVYFDVLSAEKKSIETCLRFPRKRPSMPNLTICLTYLVRETKRVYHLLEHLSDSR